MKHRLRDTCVMVSSSSKRFNGQFDREIFPLFLPSSLSLSLSLCSLTRRGHFRPQDGSRPRKWHRCAARRETVIEEEINSPADFVPIVLVPRLTSPFRYEFRPITIFRSRTGHRSIRFLRSLRFAARGRIDRCSATVKTSENIGGNEFYKNKKSSFFKIKVLQDYIRCLRYKKILMILIFDFAQ